MTTKIKALIALTQTINSDDKDTVIKIIPEWSRQFRNNLFYGMKNKKKNLFLKLIFFFLFSQKKKKLKKNER